MSSLKMCALANPAHRHYSCLCKSGAQLRSLLKGWPKDMGWQSLASPLTEPVDCENCVCWNPDEVLVNVNQQDCTKRLTCLDRDFPWYLSLPQSQLKVSLPSLNHQVVLITLSLLLPSSRGRCAVAEREEEGACQKACPVLLNHKTPRSYY